MTRTNPKLATCGKCNSTDVSWFKSRKSGKFYLCEVFTDNEGDSVSSSRDFHSKYCGNPAAHATEQARILGGNPAPTPEPQPTPEPVDYEQAALDISNTPSTLFRTLAIARLVKDDRQAARAVSAIWHRQGENTLAAQIDGALGFPTD